MRRRLITPHDLIHLEEHETERFSLYAQLIEQKLSPGKSPSLQKSIDLLFCSLAYEFSDVATKTSDNTIPSIAPSQGNIIDRFYIFKAQTKDCYHCPYIDGCIDRSSEIKRKIKEIKAEARKAVQGKFISNPKFSEEILVSRASIDEWTNQPFMYMTEKHQMLLDIERVLREAEYLGPADNHKERKGVKRSHIFQTHVVDIDAYIIVSEYSTGEFILHSISDSPNILNFLKRKIANEGN